MRYHDHHADPGEPAFTSLHSLRSLVIMSLSGGLGHGWRESLLGVLLAVCSQVFNSSSEVNILGVFWNISCIIFKTVFVCFFGAGVYGFNFFSGI